MLCFKLAFLLIYSVQYISVTGQIKIKFAFIIILMAVAAACVIEKIVCYVTCVEEKRNTHRILVEKCEGKRSLGRLWQNLKLILMKETGRVGTGLI